jgi:hypothetical protein
MNNGLINHVLVDFENVSQLDFSGFGERVIKLTLLLGKNQTRLESRLVEQLLAHAADVHFVQLASTAKNAVDFALTYYLGRAVCADPTGFFHVISKDKGFDPLVAHLSTQHVKISRHDDFTSCVARIVKPASREASIARPNSTVTLSASESTTAANGASREVTIAEIWAHVTSNGSNQPKKRTTLANQLQTHYHMSEHHAASVITQLVAQRHIAISDTGKVTYLHKAPPAGALH